MQRTIGYLLDDEVPIKETIIAIGGVPASGKTTLILSFVTFIHIFFSYKGFKLLDSGIAYTIFYLYPIMLLFWKDKSFSIFYIITMQIY